MRVRRSVLGLALAAVLVGVMPGAASAAPAPFEWLPFDCEELGSVQLVAPGADGTFTPAFVRSTNVLLVPYAFDVTISSIYGTYESADSKAAPSPGDEITCTIDHTVHFGGVGYTITGWIMGVLRGEP
jgi:hypothetical protein